jgi:hypothetical protein
MANTFLRKISRNIGNTAVTVGDYTVGANIGAVVVGLGISNTIASQVHANVSINNGTDDFYLVKSAPIFDSSTLILVGNEQKIVLQTGDSIKVTSSDSSSLDVVMTIMETDGVGITGDPINAGPVTITANVSSVNEGNTVAFSISNITANAFAYGNGTYYWSTNSISGNITAADFVGVSNTGSFTVTNGSGTILRTISADVTTEGTEIFTISVREGSTSGNIIATSANVTIADTSIEPPIVPGVFQTTINNPNAFDTSEYDQFGISVGISGNNIIIGAYEEDDAGGSESGKAYIHNATTGALIYTLNNPNAFGTSENDQFGFSVGISGDYAIVGAYLEDDAGGASSGKAYIYNATTGALIYTLNNPANVATSASDQFGYSVDINGNYAIIGAPGTVSSQGKSYIYNVTTGALVYTLDGSSGSFGRSVAVNGSYAIVGAPFTGALEGTAYIYNVTTGALVYTLTNPNAFGTSSADQFGTSVDINGNYAIVGAPDEDGTGENGIGIAYIYNVTTGALVHTIPNPNPVFGDWDGDNFGAAVSITGNFATVGAPYESNLSAQPNVGKVYVFNVITGALIQTVDNQNAFGNPTGDQFGSAVASDGDFFIVSAIGEDDVGNPLSGKVYIYKR